MGPIYRPETSVRNYYSLRNNPEERSSQEDSFPQQIGLKFKKLVKFYIWSTAWYGAETLTFRKIDHNYREKSEM